MKQPARIPFLPTLLSMSALAVASYLMVSFWYMPAARKNEELRREILALEKRVEQERRIGEELEQDLHDLLNDTNTVERLAREVLMLARPGETVVRFEP